MSEPIMDDRFAAYEANQRAIAELETTVLPENKTALFDALAAAGIHSIVVTFDGSGDSGQIELIEAFTVESSSPEFQMQAKSTDLKSTDLPTTKISFKTINFHDRSIVSHDQSAREIMEVMAYDFLQQTHGGWENNDGAYGEFRFDVADRTITLDYNERFTDSTYYAHEF